MSAANKCSPDGRSDIRDCPKDVALPPPGFAGAHPSYGSERKRAANRRNSRLSTGPRSAAGKARVKHNALRHGLNVKVADDPPLTEEVERIARQQRKPVAAVHMEFEKDGTLGRIASHIQTEKTLNFLFEHARKTSE